MRYVRHKKVNGHINRKPEEERSWSKSYKWRESSQDFSNINKRQHLNSGNSESFWQGRYKEIQGSWSQTADDVLKAIRKNK